MSWSRRTAVVAASILIVLLVIGLVVVGGKRDEGPVFEGRTLGEWLGGIDLSHWEDRRSPQFLEISNAVTQIGTNGFPSLLRWIEYEPSAAAIRFWTAFDQIDDYLPSTQFEDRIRIFARRDFDRAEATVVAFRVLGEQAKPCIPQLVSTATTSTNTTIARRAVESLSAIGEPARSSVLDLFLGTNQLARFFSIPKLRTMGTNALPALPQLLVSLADPNETVSRRAAGVLGDLQLAPETVVPALTISLQASSPITRQAAAEALAKFGRLAVDSTPALEKALEDESTVVREAASNALQRIRAADLVPNRHQPE